jgi:hypothetical protein
MGVADVISSLHPMNVVTKTVSTGMAVGLIIFSIILMIAGTVSFTIFTSKIFGTLLLGLGLLTGGGGFYLMTRVVK